MVCDNSRGLLLGDHMGKIPTGILKDEIDDEYKRQMPSSHHGAVASRGTDLVHHFILTCLEIAKALSISIGLLFVDL